MTHTQIVHRGSPLSEEERRILAQLVETEGERAVLERVGCSRQALRSALAARPVYGVTRRCIGAALAAVAREAAP